MAQDVCPACRRPAPVSPATRQKLEALSGKPLGGEFYQGEGCEECRGGYRCRIGIFELLAINPALRELILQKRSTAELKSTAQRNMITMQQDALKKATAGQTTLEEIIRVCSGGNE